jgi:CheY-like chemotaxis protein
MLVALTGWGQETDRQRSKEAGFDVHMVKPVDPIALATLHEPVQSRNPPDPRGGGGRL